MKTRNLDQLLSAVVVVALLRPLIIRAGESARGVDHRIRSALLYAIKTGRLPRRKKVQGLAGQQFHCGEVMALAREIASWGLMESERAACFPASVGESISEELRAMDMAEATVIPGDPERRRQLLIEQQNQIREKDIEIARLHARVTVLEAMVARFQSFRMKSGRRGSWTD